MRNLALVFGLVALLHVQWLCRLPGCQAALLPGSVPWGPSENRNGSKTVSVALAGSEADLSLTWRPQMAQVASRVLVPTLGAEFALPPCLILPERGVASFGPVTYRWTLDNVTMPEWEWTASVDGSAMKPPAIDLETVLRGKTRRRGGQSVNGDDNDDSVSDRGTLASSVGKGVDFDVSNRAFVRLDDGALVYPKIPERPSAIRNIAGNYQCSASNDEGILLSPVIQVRLPHMSSAFSEYPGFTQSAAKEGSSVAVDDNTSSSSSSSSSNEGSSKKTTTAANNKRGNRKRNKNKDQQQLLQQRNKLGRNNEGSSRNASSTGDVTSSSSSSTTTSTSVMAMVVGGSVEEAMTADIVVVVGQNVRFPCRIDSTPAAVISWQRDRKPLPQNERYVTLPSGTLQIFDVSESDAGKYRCIAENVALKRRRASPEGVLRISVSNEAEPSPSWTSPSTVVSISSSSPTFASSAMEGVVQPLEGENVTLECLISTTAPSETDVVAQGRKNAVSAFPPPLDIRWRRMGDDLPSRSYTVGPRGQNLVLPGVTSADDGLYVCLIDGSDELAGKEGKIRLKTAFAPKILSGPQSVRAVLASLFRFNCTVDAYPSATVQWFKNGVRLTSVDRIRHRYDNQLVVSNVLTKDAGVYECIATNSMGSTAVAAKVSINAPAEVHHPINLQVWSNPQKPNTTAIVTWDLPAATPGQVQIKLIAFTIHYSHPGGQEATLLVGDGAEKTWALIDKLDPKETYSFYVRAYTSTSASETSPSVTWHVGLNRPVQPDLSLEEVNTTAVQVRWEGFAPESARSGEITKYMIQWRTGRHEKNQVSSELEVSARLKSKIVGGLTPGVEYEFRVLGGNDDDGYPMYMQEVFQWRSIVTPTQIMDHKAMSALLQLTVDRVDSTSARAAWEIIDDSAKDAINSYKIEVKTVGNERTITAVLPVDRDSHVLRNLDPAGKYVVSLTPLVNAGFEDSVDSSAVLKTLDMDAYLRAPKLVHVKEVTPGSISLWWTPVKGAAKYNLTIREESRVEPRQGTLDVSKSEAVLDMLKPNTVYTICVRAVDQWGNNTACSRDVSQKTHPIGAPVGVNYAISSATKIVNIGWKAPRGLFRDDEVMYQVIYYDDMSPGVAWKDVTTNALKAELMDLIPERTYTVHVRVVAVNNVPMEGPLSKPPINFLYHPDASEPVVDGGFVDEREADELGHVTGHPDPVETASSGVGGKLEKLEKSYGLLIAICLCGAFIGLSLLGFVAYRICVVRARREANINGGFPHGRAHGVGSGLGSGAYRSRRRLWPFGGSGGPGGGRTLNGNNNHGGEGGSAEGTGATMANSRLFMGNGNGMLCGSAGEPKANGGGRVIHEAEAHELSAMTPMLPRAGGTSAVMMVSHNHHSFIDEDDHRFDPRNGSSTRKLLATSSFMSNNKQPVKKTKPVRTSRNGLIFGGTNKSTSSQEEGTAVAPASGSHSPSASPHPPLTQCCCQCRCHDAQHPARRRVDSVDPGADADVSVSDDPVLARTPTPHDDDDEEEDIDEEEAERRLLMAAACSEPLLSKADDDVTVVDAAGVDSRQPDGQQGSTTSTTSSSCSSGYDSSSGGTKNSSSTPPANLTPTPPAPSVSTVAVVHCSATSSDEETGTSLKGRQQRQKPAASTKPPNWTSVLLSQTSDYALVKPPSGTKTSSRQRASVELTLA